MSKKLISQGAEAKILKEKDFIIKDRISKGYRHPILDKQIIKQRTKRESNILEKAHKLIGSPNPEVINFNQIKMPFIEGKKLSDNLESLDYKEICKEIAHNISKLHDNNIIHGDLTTSNMIFVENNNKTSSTNKNLKNNLTINNEIKQESELVQLSSKKANNSKPNSSEVIFIDFGLGYTSSRIEDKAVDLHLIKQALEAKHFSIYKECWKIIHDNYNSKEHSKVLEQLKKVEARGRYKQAG